jgi:tetratricopeptide (TPR) repeat protein
MTAWLLFFWIAQATPPPASGNGSGSGSGNGMSAKKAAAGDPVGQYLADLEKSGALPAEEPSLEKLKAALVTAEDDLVTGNPQVAATRLFRVVESPRWNVLAFAPEYQNAEFALARSLVRLGAYGSAKRYLLRVLARGGGQPYFAAATRVMVDIALETRDATGILALLNGIRSAEPLPRDSKNEQGYLRGKVAYEAGELAAADAAFGDVDKQSRFYASALYFRGLIQARQGRYASARRNLCEIVEPADKGRFSFFIDGRYYAIRDLAYLALGRIAHEQRRYDDAYYFYFRVPEDSDRLPDALYEASWSMFQKGEYEAAGAFIDQFDRMFPKSPLAPDVLLLHAMIDLKSCAFDRVRTTLNTFVKTYAPVQAEVATLVRDTERRRALYRRLLDKDHIGAERDPIIELLKIDPQFFRYYSYIVALDREAGLLPGDVAAWNELGTKVAAKGAADEDQSAEAAQLANDVQALVAQAKGDPVLEEQVGALLDETRQAARPIDAGRAFGADAAATRALGVQVRRLRAQLVTTATALAEAALGDLDRRLRKLLRQARLTHIDALIGKKKKLEIEIANLREGRYPPDMFAQLQLEGLMGDEEEYWPFEGEYWSDEYENYK